MKKITILLFISIVYNSAYTQQDYFSIHFSQIYSKYRFIDSEGKKDDNLSTNIKYGYGINFLKTFSSGIFIRPELGYKNYGANSTMDTEKLNWSTHYVDLNFGGGYILKGHKIEPSVFAALFFSYMYKGTQEIGSASYDMVKLKLINNTDYGFYAGCKLFYSFTDNAGFFVEYRNNVGLRQLEKNADEGSKQKMYNRASSIHVGLAFKIEGKSKEENKTK